MPHRRMTHWKPMAALAVCLMGPACWLASPAPRAPAAAQGPALAANPAPSPEQIHSLITRAIENQHRNDRELQEFERAERMVTRKTENGDVLADLTERVVPSGTGTIK